MYMWLFLPPRVFRLIMQKFAMYIIQEAAFKDTGVYMYMYMISITYMYMYLYIPSNNKGRNYVFSSFFLNANNNVHCVDV